MATQEYPPNKQKICEGGYHCQFKEDNDCLKCSSCSRVSRDPQLTMCCDEQFCASYLHKDDNTPERSCPKCEKDLHFVPNLWNHKQILRLLVLCTVNGRGCDWEGQLGELGKHEDKCEHIEVACPKKCGQHIKRASLERHIQSDCPERDYQCPHCNFKGTYAHVTTGHQCLPIQQVDVETHIRDESVLEYARCKFQHTGCNGKFQREKEQEHMETNSQHHLDLLAGATSKMSEELRRLREETERWVDNLIAEQKSQNEQKNEEIAQLRAELAQQTKTQDEALRQIQNDTEIADLKAELEQERGRVDVLESQVGNMNNNVHDDISPPENPGDGEQREHGELERKIREKDGELEQLHKMLEEHKTSSDKEHQQLNHRMMKLEKLLNNAESTAVPSASGSAALVVANSLPTLLPTFVLDNYTSLKAAGGQWNSPTFPAYENGPELKLIVWHNGQENGKGTHISVWLGTEFAIDSIPAPFKITLTLELVGQGGEDFNQIPVKVTKEFIVPGSTSPWYAGDFSNTFIAHEDLNQYLVDNKLTFQISSMHVTSP